MLTATWEYFWPGLCRGVREPYTWCNAHTGTNTLSPQPLALEPGKAQPFLIALSFVGQKHSRGFDHIPLSARKGLGLPPCCQGPASQSFEHASAGITVLSLKNVLWPQVGGRAGWDSVPSPSYHNCLVCVLSLAPSLLQPSHSVSLPVLQTLFLPNLQVSFVTPFPSVLSLAGVCCVR